MVLTEAEEIELELTKRQLASRDFLQFCYYTFPWFEAKAYQSGRLIHEQITSKLQWVADGKIKRLMIFCPPRLWKQIADSCNVITNKWWKMHWELKVWDFVFDNKWDQRMITWVSKKTNTEYRMYFSDGSDIDCHWNHDRVFSRDRSKYKKYTTRELYSSEMYRSEWTKQRFYYALPKVSPINFVKKQFTIDPYLLWFWLWDGNAATGVICKPKADLDEVIEKIWLAWYGIKSRWSATYDCDYTTVDWLTKQLKDLGLQNNKHIPKEYLLWSIEQRLELLAWLIDSDWTVSDYRGYTRVSFSNTSKDLINWVDYICKSMWWKTTIWTQAAGTKWGRDIISTKDCDTISFTPYSNIPTVITRKRISKAKTKKRNIKLIWVERLDKDLQEQWNCIEVDGGIYLVWDNMIPTHNSILSSQYFPAFFLWKNPGKNIIQASYGADLSSWFGRKTKQITQSLAYKNTFPDFELSIEKREWGNRETKEWWWMYTVWVWGATTGKGADIFIIDDPVKDRVEADSPTTQERNVDRYDSVVSTRLQSQDSAVIVIMTRWNIYDLWGYLLEEEKQGWEEWDKLVIQGIDEKWNEIIRPGKWDEWYMEEKKSNMIPKNRAALYQQDPIASMDGIFKREYMDYFLMSDFERDDGILKKNDLEIWLFIDPAFSSSKKSDDAVVIALGKHKLTKEYYQLDLYADTSAPSRTFAAILSMYNRLTTSGFKIQFISVEDVTINREQVKFINDLRLKLVERELVVPLRLYKPRVSKNIRIQDNLEPIMSQKGIKFRNDLPDTQLTRRMEKQFLDFPNWKHDDIIDCLTQWYYVLNNKSSGTGLKKARRTKMVWNVAQWKMIKVAVR